MKEIDYLPIDFIRKCNLAEIAKKYEGRDVYLMLKSDSWDDTYVAVIEDEIPNKLKTCTEKVDPEKVERLKKMFQEVTRPRNL